MTRFGMREDEMREIARLMRRVAIDGEDPGKVAGAVRELRSGFLEVKYTFPFDPSKLPVSEKLPLLY